MSGPTPLVPTYRLELTYIQQLMTHKLHMYLGVTPSADVMGYDTIARSGKSPVGLHVAVDQVWGTIDALMPTPNSSFGQALLQQHVGAEWRPISVYATAVTPAGGSTPYPANEVTFVFRTQNFERLNLVFLEMAFHAPNHFTSYGALDSVTQGLVNSWSNAGGTAVNADPYSWQLGRDGTFIKAWQSVTASLNRKIRRKRGLS